MNRRFQVSLRDLLWLVVVVGAFCAGMVIGEGLERQHVTWIIGHYPHTDPANVIEIIREDLEPRNRSK